MTLGVFTFPGLSLLPNNVYKKCYFVNSVETCFIISEVMYDRRIVSPRGGVATILLIKVYEFTFYLCIFNCIIGAVMYINFILGY